MAFDFDSLVADNIRILRPYQPGKPIETLERELGITGAIKVASNENPMGPSPKAIAAAREALAKVHLYPDGGAYQLRTALADKLGVGPDHLVFGAGSNELIHLIMRTFTVPGRDQVLAPKYAFISYKAGAIAHGVEFVESEVNDQLGCDVDAMLAAVTERTRVVFVANPNNPTGAYVPRADFERLLDGIPDNVILVVDEAYHEYASRAAADYPQAQQYMGESRPLIINLRTFSKIYGLAGLRIGYGLCDPRIANFIDRVRRPFNANSVGQAAALAALDDDAHVDASSDAAVTGIAALRAAAEAAGVKAYPSLGNFVLVDVGRDSEPVHDALQKDGVIVRPMRAWGLPTCLRISVGTQAESERASQALARAL
ncbi:MAG: histidinol-phosphate transaminase [Deltaproteobacteria bacterium]|nr:histidinol-phosphate transaminase [Deltaproteobacteria bacterium]